MFEDDFNKNCTPYSRKLLGLDDYDPIEYSDKFFKSLSVAETSIDPNGNVGKISPNSYFTELSKPYAKKYFFKKLYEKGSKLYKDFSLNKVYDGTIYIHDATKLQPYCFGFSATDIALFGRPHGTLVAKPPKRLESFMSQMSEIFMELSQEFAGALACTDLVPWMAWYVEQGNYDDKKIENIFQSFVYILNNNFRIGGDSPFTNISVNSKDVYYDIFDHYIFPDGKTIDDLFPTIMRIQKIIINFMKKGCDGLPYRFPILTANFKANKNESQTEWFKYISRENANGFMNINYAERFSLCCRLQLEFDYKQNSFGGGGVKIGSMRVANINLPRLAYQSSSKEHFMRLLYETIEQSIKYISAYAEIFKELIKIKYLRFFNEPSNWYNFNMFFGTIGFCGIWDATEILNKNLTILRDNWVPSDLLDTINKKVDFMYEIISLFVDKTKKASNGIKFNVEQVPSEAAAGTMAKFNHDYHEKRDYYSNQFIPLQINIPLHKRIEYEAKLQSTLTGGGMTFLNFDSKLTPEQSLEIHTYMLEHGFEGQFCINYGYTKCKKCKTVEYGISEQCVCGSNKVENYTRLVGYFAEIHQTAKSKTMEIKDRKTYVFT